MPQRNYSSRRTHKAMCPGSHLTGADTASVTPGVFGPRARRLPRLYRSVELSTEPPGPFPIGRRRQKTAPFEHPELTPSTPSATTHFGFIREENFQIQSRSALKLVLCAWS